MAEEPKLSATVDPPPLPEYRQLAIARVNSEAEVERRKLLTPGSGQALEYRETQKEARQAVDQGAADYSGLPMLEAEDSAAQSAGAPARSVLVVANEILARVDAIRPTAAAIRAERLSAVYRLERAQSHAEVDAILAGLLWPDLDASK